MSEGASGDSEVSLLFSVVAPTMEVVAEGDGFRLTVASTSPAAWFTDRPDRQAGSFDVADLVSIWSTEEFDTDPPNAAIVVTVDGEQHQHVIELTDPIVTPTTVSFHATDIGDDESTDDVANRSSTHDIAVGSYGESELFIDNGSTPPCPSSITSATFATCVIAANGSVTFKVTPQSSGQDVVLAQAQKGRDALTILVGRSPMSVSIDDAAPEVSIEYTSGQTWKIGNGALPVFLSFEAPMPDPID